MGLDSLVRKGVALANSITGALQVTVVHTPWIGADDYGTAIYGTATEVKALVEAKTQILRAGSAASGSAVGSDPGSEALVQRHLVTVIGPMAPTGATGRQEPIDPRDLITLPDGSSWPILAVQGLQDPATGAPYLYQVSLG